MREARKPDDVSARLRTVLAPTTAPVRGRPVPGPQRRSGSPWDTPPGQLAADAGPIDSRGGPSTAAAPAGSLAPAEPLASGGSSRSTVASSFLGSASPGGSDGSGQAEEGGAWPEPDGPPLTWADVLPGWPDDVTLERDDPADRGPAPPHPAVVPAADALATRPPWAPATAAQRPPALFPPTPFGDDELQPTAGGAQPLRPPALFAPTQFGDDEGYLTEEGDRPLSGAGAFDDAPRSRLSAFDPGRRGVKALAAVAIVVVLIAAFLAWRARPRVDPVAPPRIDPAAADASLTDGNPPPGAVPGAKPSAPAAVVVAVGGKVRKPGLVELPSGARVADALTAAGGANPGVDVASLNLARKVTDGELIMVGVTPPPGAAPAAPAGPAAPGQPGAGPLNLNAATLADLDTLPGVGPVLAQRILAAREAQGGFKAVSDLRNVEGIGTSRYDQLKDLVTV